MAKNLRLQLTRYLDKLKHIYVYAADQDDLSSTKSEYLCGIELLESSL